MAETARFGVTLLEAAQAQKHVTMNEALARLDALGAGRVEALGTVDPPADPAEGAMWAIGAGATGAWAGQDGRLAMARNGGWDFATPFRGQSLWDAETGTEWRHDGNGWVDGVIAATPGGAMTQSLVAEIDHAVAAGASSTTAPFIPDKAVVIGVTARVIEEIGGAAAWSLGVVGSLTRYGTGFGVEAGAFAHGVTTEPLAYYGGTSLVLSAAGDDSTGGTVRIAAHFLAVRPPSAA